MEERALEYSTKFSWSKQAWRHYELAERNFISENGVQKLFNGFLGDQASHLFEITKTREN